MKQLTLSAAYALLDACSALIIDDDVLIYPSLDTLSSEGASDPDNEFLHLSWEIEGLEYSCTFAEGPNTSVMLDKDTIVLVDMEGHPTRLKLLFSRNLEAEPATELSHVSP